MAGRAILDGIEQVVQLRMAHLGGNVVAAHVVGEGSGAEVQRRDGRHPVV